MNYKSHLSVTAMSFLYSALGILVLILSFQSERPIGLQFFRQSDHSLLGTYTDQIILGVLPACISCTAAAKIRSAHQIRLELVKTMSLSVMHSVDITSSRDTLSMLHYLS